MMRIGEFLKRNKTAVTIEDDKTYKRATIKVRNGGIFLRDEEIGSKIGTKNQFLIFKGQFLLSKIDARNGAFGVVPEELDGGIITGNFWTFDVNYDIVNPHYLALLTTTKAFVDFCEQASNGTTNRHYLQEPLFLNIKVPVPSLAEQNKLVEEYNTTIARALSLDNKIISLKSAIDEYICTTLGYNYIDTDSNQTKRLLSMYHYKNLGRWDIFNLDYAVQSDIYDTIPLKDIIIGKPKYGASYKTVHKVSDIRYIRITDINEDGTLNEDIVSADGYDSQYLLQNNDFLIARSGNTVGKTFLYDDSVGKAIYAGYLIKFDLDTNKVNPKYLLYYTKSSIYKKWINSNMRVSAQPNINSEQYLFSPIILPDIEMQNSIVKYIDSIVDEIAKLTESSKTNKAIALTNFETQIFE